MRLRNHIAYRFLTDKKWHLEYILRRHNLKADAPIADTDPRRRAVQEDYDLISAKSNKTFVVTETVTDKLDLLKVKRLKNGHFDWTIFDHLEVQKATFILPGNRCLRVKFYTNSVYFMLLLHEPQAGNPNKMKGVTNWVRFQYYKEDKDRTAAWTLPEVVAIEEYVYKLLCFLYLSDNEEIVLVSGESSGTKKTGKIINELPFEVTIINSCWNTKIIRNEGFSVSGHFAIRRCGQGRSSSRVVLIEPYKKSGYNRRSGKEIDEANQPNSQK